MSAPLLELRGIRFRHPAAPADRLTLDAVSLRIDRGEVLGLVGPNAAGKSTLGRIACGLLEPLLGEVRLCGDPMTSLSRRERARRVAFHAQHQPQDLPFTAREVALMGRTPHLGLWALEREGDHACAEAALAELDAANLADRPMAQLSGGERQRAFLARALAQKTPLLVLDEPLASLDLAHQVQLAGVVRRRAAAGGGALLVLHDLALAGSTCDRIALLVAGRIAAEGVPREVLEPVLLGRAYDTPVDVVLHPATGAPLVAARIPPHSR